MDESPTTPVHLLTFSCYRKRRLFRDDALFKLFEQTLVEELEHKNVACLSYVIMPSHVHLLVEIPDSQKGLLFKRSLKRTFSFRAFQWIEQNEPGLQDWLRVRHGLQEKRRFWQAGGGHDRILSKEDEIRNAISYCHENPVRAGLVDRAEEWRWSSAGLYLPGNVGVVPIQRPSFL